MDRERARLLIRNQQREHQRSRSPRVAGLRSFLAPRQSQPDCHPDRRITFKTFAEAEKACEVMLVNLTT
jgi:hypothetical protein